MCMDTSNGEGGVGERGGERDWFGDKADFSTVAP